MLMISRLHGEVGLPSSEQPPSEAVAALKPLEFLGRRGQESPRRSTFRGAFDHF
jgi:hypothetical protein